jgi:hypothetical protein
MLTAARIALVVERLWRKNQRLIPPTMATMSATSIAMAIPTTSPPMMRRLEDRDGSDVRVILRYDFPVI